jgi:hypothetical protein
LFKRGEWRWCSKTGGLDWWITGLLGFQQSINPKTHQSNAPEI